MSFKMKVGELDVNMSMLGLVGREWNGEWIEEWASCLWYEHESE